MMRIAMLISGGGTTMQAIIRACRNGILTDKVEPALVIASKSEAGGLQKALTEGVPKRDILVIAKRDYPDELAFGGAILNACQERKIDFIGQYGWMVKTPPNVIKAFSGMMVNQHPGPLDPGRPDFGGQGMFGLRVHCARLLFVRLTRCAQTTEATAQRVAIDYDKGALLHLREVDINVLKDTPESIQQRLLPREHEVQIETLKMFGDGHGQEIQRAAPLIRSGEEKILEYVKQKAAKLYPNG